MKILVACLLLCFLGVTIASPAPSWPDYSQWYNTYNRALNGGQENNEKITQAQSHWGRYLTDYLSRQIGGGGHKQTSRDEVTALMENLLNAQHIEEHNDEVAMQSFFKVMAKIEEEKAKEMDSKSARAQYLRDLGSTLFNAGRNFLVDRYCPKEGSTESSIKSAGP
jgi:hypothetical protein